MTKRGVNIALGAIVLVAAILRVLALRYEPAHHPDEYFQYLEPAWGRLTGAWIETWEWRSGVRSWVLPGYHGAWMALLMMLGVRDGTTIGKFLQAHWALLSMSLVWAGWRGGMLLARRLGPNRALAISGELPSDGAPPLGWQGGLIGALLCAAFPLQVRFSIHTLSEQASILCMVCALVLTAELACTVGREGRKEAAKKAAWMGFILGLGICLRIQHAPVPLVVALWLLVARRFWLAVVATLASLLPVMVFGLVDKLTWGGFFASFIGYVKFNLIEGGASIFGTQPWKWYLEHFLQRLPMALPVLALLCIVGIRANWPFVVSALGLTLLLSTQAHKEERFVMLFWPLVLIAAAATAGAWLCPRESSEVWVEGAPLRPRRGRTWLVRSVILAALTLVFVDGARHCRGNDFTGLDRGRYAAQTWAGRQADITGLLYDQPLYTGGYLWFGRNFPQLIFQTDRLKNPLFSHALVEIDSGLMIAAQRAGFTKVFSADNFVVLRRTSGPVSP